jgi:hypothetical protein
MMGAHKTQREIAAARWAIEKRAEGIARGHATGTRNLTGKAVSIGTALEPERTREKAAEKFGVSPQAFSP